MSYVDVDMKLDLPGMDGSRSGRRAIARQTLSDELARRLRDMIAAGELRPGSRVNTPRLCSRFGVSRTPLREALKVLATEGLVQLMPGARQTMTLAGGALAEGSPCYRRYRLVDVDLEPQRRRPPRYADVAGEDEAAAMDLVEPVWIRDPTSASGQSGPLVSDIRRPGGKRTFWSKLETSRPAATAPGSTARRHLTERSAGGPWT